jgi:Na+/melibiose symporter-like transporter
MRWLYGTGGVGLGILETGVYNFVLIYYSQILGLSASLTGFALAVALVFDAVSDPAVGFLSDNWKSRWGRRHPFLYASIVPCALFYYLLWFPPSGITGQLPLFLYLMGCTVGLRLGMTLFDVPSNAAIPELASDYEERTTLFTYKLSATWVIWSVMSIAMYAIWLQPTPEYADGVLNPEGYREAGWIGALLIAVLILAFSVGLHRFIPQLRGVENRAVGRHRNFVHQTIEVLRNPSLRAMIISGMAYWTASVAQNALWIYVYSFFWEFTSDQMSILIIPIGLGSFAAIYVLPRFGAGREKKAIAIQTMLLGTVLSLLPIALRLIGIFPENGSSALFWILIVQGFLTSMIWVMVAGIWRSMTADLVEQEQFKNGQRSEGLILSALTFTGKAAGALGTWVAGIMLDLASFPIGAAVAEIPAEALAKLGWIYGPVLMVFYVVAAYFVSRYKFSRAEHSAAVEILNRT